MSAGAKLPALSPQMELLPAYAEARQALERARTIDDAAQIRSKAEALHAYAIKARDRELECAAGEIRMRAERKAGEMLIATGLSGSRAGRGRPQKMFPVGTFNKAKLNEREFESRLLRMRGLRASTQRFLKGPAALRCEEYLTPRYLIDAAILVMGQIDLDPCAECKPPARPNVPASGHFTKEDSALKRTWTGRVFMNPGHGPSLHLRADHLTNSYAAGDVTEFVAMMPARTDQSWFMRLCNVAIWCGIGGSIRWGGVGGAPDFTLGQPFAAFYAGPNGPLFLRYFDRFGRIYRAFLGPEITES